MAHTRIHTQLHTVPSIYIVLPYSFSMLAFIFSDVEKRIDIDLPDKYEEKIPGDMDSDEDIKSDDDDDDDDDNNSHEDISFSDDDDD